MSARAEDAERIGTTGTFVVGDGRARFHRRRKWQRAGGLPRGSGRDPAHHGPDDRPISGATRKEAILRQKSRNRAPRGDVAGGVSGGKVHLSVSPSDGHDRFWRGG